ncbi:MAG: hypothetical protein ACTHK7_16415, partial [Aureliella sp.]
MDFDSVLFTVSFQQDRIGKLASVNSYFDWQRPWPRVCFRFLTEMERKASIAILQAESGAES